MDRRTLLKGLATAPAALLPAAAAAEPAPLDPEWIERQANVQVITDVWVENGNVVKIKFQNIKCWDGCKHPRMHVSTGSVEG